MNTQQQIDRLIGALDVAGRRSTPQRYAVCQALVEHGGHPTVAEIFERVRETFPMISQATIYNTVDTLCSLGLLLPLELNTDGHTHYDLDPTPHVNLVCNHCGAIVDLHPNLLEGLLMQVGDQSGYRIDRANPLVIYGVCAECIPTR
ncbi:MAG: transcriptional repressor [Oscillochloris sp.]|nr:transcriptional repressor [Oscillochloris sp.]